MSVHTTIWKGMHVPQPPQKLVCFCIHKRTCVSRLRRNCENERERELEIEDEKERREGKGEGEEEREGVGESSTRTMQLATMEE